MPITITKRWSSDPVFTSETATTKRQAIIEALALKVNLRGSDLRGSNLRGSNLSGSDLSGSDLRGSNLRGSDLSGSRGLTIEQITGPPFEIPKLENIHRTLLAAITKEGCRLDMKRWHTCETTHCRAGWIIAMAGDKGKELEEHIGTPAAAFRIYLESDPTMGRMPNWYASDEQALAEIKRNAELEEKYGTADEPAQV